jgi:hypothetical protein
MIEDNEEYNEDEVNQETKSLVNSAFLIAVLITALCIGAGYLAYKLW